MANHNECYISKDDDRSNKIIQLLDDIPQEIRMQHIFPHISPQVLVWLNRDYYLQYHYLIRYMISASRTSRFPLGIRQSYIRYMIRIDSSFVIKQLLNENARVWLKAAPYYYHEAVYPSYLHFLFHLTTHHSASKCRICINEKAIELIGQKWLKRSRRDHSNKRWSN